MNHAKKMMIDHIAKFGSDSHSGWGAVMFNPGNQIDQIEQAEDAVVDEADGCVVELLPDEQDARGGLRRTE